MQYTLGPRGRKKEIKKEQEQSQRTFVNAQGASLYLPKRQGKGGGGYGEASGANSYTELSCCNWLVGIAQQDRL